MAELTRGGIVRFAERGDYTSKPRPGVVIQHQSTLADAPSITLCGITTVATPGNVTRIALTPSSRNGLREVCFVMIDKVATIRRERIRDAIGVLEIEEMALIDEALRRWLDL